jgi:hypothetical protein
VLKDKDSAGAKKHNGAFFIDTKLELKQILIFMHG